MRLIGAINFCSLTIAIILMTGCANTNTKYQPKNWYHDGYSEEKISDSIYKVSFLGRLTDFLTIQTYWLLRASDLAIENGYDGFQITPVQFDSTGNTSASHRANCPDLDIVCTQYIYSPYWKEATGEIHLLKGSIKPIPKTVFNAHLLKASIENVIKNDCGNPDSLLLPTSRICPHNKSYLSGNAD